MACLDDQLLLSVLGQLSGHDLSRLAQASKALYCFAYHEPLWKALCLQEAENFGYSGSWRQTVARLSAPGFTAAAPLRVQGMFSDVLFQSWHVAHASLQEAWLEVDNIERRDASQMTVDEFRRDFELPNRPVIITGEVTQWPAFKQWSHARLQQVFAGKLLNAGGGCRMEFENYLKYSAESRDELPLYLFDKQCLGWEGSLHHRLADDYTVPEYFSQDLFSMLGEERPDWRWLIVGPPNSGSSFHKDPNSTGAWNAVLQGSKKWVLWPPASPPPGVHPSEDGLEVSSPYTLHEWFESFYPHAHEEGKAIECICRAGELLFVPRGWWHLAVNLEETTAITQNYVSDANLEHVLWHLRDPTLVSGCSIAERPTLHDRFVAALRLHQPQVLQALQRETEAKARAGAKQRALTSLFNAKGSTADGQQSNAKRQRTAPIDSGIDEVAQPASSGSFSFGFAL